MAVVVDAARIGALISSMGSPGFGAQFFDLFRDDLDIDQCTVFAFRGSLPPDPLVLEGRSPEMRQCAHSLAQEYRAGAFVQDPNVSLGKPLSAPTVHCLNVAEVPDSDYRRRFYDQPRLTHELVVLGQTDDILYYSSFYRSDRNTAFSPYELERMTELADLALKALHRHLELLGGRGLQSWKAAGDDRATPTAQRRQELAARLRDVLLSEPYDLTEREAEVCSCIILGFTMLGISLTLGISVNTVATYRKRAYRKLAISSQNELFSRYFGAVNQHNERFESVRN